MGKTKRRFLAVTVKPELHAKVQAAASKRDIPVTAWVREAVEAELHRQDREFNK